MKNRIFITGDTHGQIDSRFEKVVNPFLYDSDLTKDDVLIVAGDFGMRFFDNKSYFEIMSIQYLENLPMSVAFVDGNHENFGVLKNLKTEEMWNSDVGKFSNSIYHLRRGRVYTIHGKKIFTMGGGFSIDKARRIPYKTWWPDEEITLDQFDLAVENLNKVDNTVDYVITHTAPVHFVNKLEKSGHVPILKLTNRTSQQYLEKLHNIITYKRWYCGHFHTHFAFKNIKTIYSNIEEIKL